MKYNRNIASYPRFKEYIDFLVERQSIWHKKEVLKLPQPWTNDWVLQKGKFTNIYRELDRVSRYEIKNIVEPFQDNPKEQIFRIMVLRHTNSPRIYECLMNGGDLNSLYCLWEVSTTKDYFISDAMIWIPPSGYDRAQWVYEYYKRLCDNLDCIVSDILGYKFADSIMSHIISRFQRVGPFYAYEMMTSFSYCNWCPFTENDFLVVGPGAYPGLQYILEDDSILVADKLIKDNYTVVRDELLKRPDYIWIPESYQPKNKEPHKFTIRTFEHSLCEFRKYKNIRDGYRIRRSYHGIESNETEVS